MVIAGGYNVDSADEPAKYFTEEIRVEAAEKYLELYARMTGEEPELRLVREDELREILERVASND